MLNSLNANYPSPSFKSINAVSGGRQFLQKLNKAEREELARLVESQKNNPISIYLAQHTGCRLSGWITFNEATNHAGHRKDYTQRILFDSPLKFIERLCKKADKLHKKYEGDIEIETIKAFEL